jgi:predicted O-methyltransferase YrrM
MQGMPRIGVGPQSQAQQPIAPATVPIFVEPGHFYSPIPDPRQLMVEPERSRIWPATPPETPGVNWRDEDQVVLCREVFARQKRMKLAETPTPNPADFYLTNDAYPPLDTWILEGMLRAIKPKRMIEVGSGYSSLVTAAVNRTYLGYDLNFTCIDPNPEDFLVPGVAGIDELIPAQVQQVPTARFEELGDGDVLFIDTAHTVKTGGDVPFLYNQVIPRLAPGVFVHLHDIFLPLDYPQPWVFEGRAWNEQYLVQSFLAFNDEFEVVFGAIWMLTFHPEEIREAFPGLERFKYTGSSLWLRRRGGRSALASDA